MLNLPHPDMLCFRGTVKVFRWRLAIDAYCSERVTPIQHLGTSREPLLRQRHSATCSADAPPGCMN
jgi:hypothetical protein